MSFHYLLPCQCGQKTAVDSSQAGLSVRCRCGASLAVPAMRGLAKLERVESASQAAAAQPAGAWGARQRLIFSGSIILVFGALGALGVWWTLPEAPSLNESYQEFNRAFIDQQSPEELLEKWQDYRTGIEQPMWESVLNRYERIFRERVEWALVAGGVAAAGLVLMAIGL